MKPNASPTLVLMFALALTSALQACASTPVNPALFGSWQRTLTNPSADVSHRVQTISFGSDASFAHVDRTTRSPAAGPLAGCVVDTNLRGTYSVNNDAIAVSYASGNAARSQCATPAQNTSTVYDESTITRFNDGEFQTGRTYRLEGDTLTLSSANGDSVFQRVRPAAGAASAP